MTSSSPGSITRAPRNDNGVEQAIVIAAVMIAVRVMVAAVIVARTVRAIAHLAGNDSKRCANASGRWDARDRRCVV